MPLIRTRQDIDKLLGGPTPAEEKLLTACLVGVPCALGETVPPETNSPAPAVHIRALVLRYLITGGCEDHPTADWGVDLRGAHVTGAMDLRLAIAHGITSLDTCRFDIDIVAPYATFEFLNLSRSSLRSLNIQGAQVRGNVYLRGITAAGNVNINAATIGGQLSCVGAQFKATNGTALSAEGARVTGGVNLSFITAETKASLSGATIGGQLSCKSAQFNATKGQALNTESAQVTGPVFLQGVTAQAEVSLAGACIGEQLDCSFAQFLAPTGWAFQAERLRVTQGFFFRYVNIEQGAVCLASARVGDLYDEPQSWPDASRLVLDGFTYERIKDASFPRDSDDADFPRVSDRLKWLRKGSTWQHEFFPQPYTQLAKVYREMGHDADARAVLFEREKQRRLHRREQTRIVPNGDFGVALKSLWRDLMNLLRLVWDVILRLVVGYGVRPFRSLWSLAALTLLATYLAHMAWEEGSMAPNSAVILTSEDWRAVAESEEIENPAATWSDRHGKGRDYATFNRYAYAADLVIPIINLGQTDAWAPSTNREIWGERLWRYGFFLTVAGWIVTALGASAITGIIRQD